MAPRLTQPNATANKLVDVMTLGGEQPTNGKGEAKTYFTSISYFPDGKQMVAASSDNSARRWDLQTGEEIVEAWCVWEQQLWAVAVSRDSRWVIAGCGDPNRNDLCATLKAYEVDTRKMKTFEGHSDAVMCIDISVDNKLLASGSSHNTARIWDLNTGKLVAGPFECVGSVGAVRFSQDSKKLALKSGYLRRNLDVWDIQEQKLDGRVGKSNSGIWPDSPVFWTTKDRSIVAAFKFEDSSEDPGKIYEFDASTLETVGAPFEAHTSGIRGLALSFDCALLASASQFDNTIKLWAFESRQLLASFDVHNPCTLTLSPNSRQLAYTSFDSSRIHICDIPLDILARLWPEQATCSTIAPDNSHRTDPLNSRPTRHPATVRSMAVSWSPAPRPLRSSHPVQPTFVRQLRKLLPSYFRRGQITPVQNDEPRDLLDFPATSRLPSFSSEAVTQVHSGMNLGEQHHPHAVTQFVRQNLSFPRPRMSHEPTVVEVAADRKFARLAVVNLPEYRKANDTRRSPPAVSQGTAENDAPHDSSDNDSLPDVHWCKAFFCYCSCWSHGALRMPPRWRLERVDEHIAEEDTMDRNGVPIANES